MTKKERAELNKIIRQILFARDGQCLKCGSTQRLQASHIYPKGKYRRMEFDIDNIKFLCWGCHFHWWHKNPIEAMEWANNILGKPRLNRLKLIAQSRNGGMSDYKLIKLYLEQELKKYAG